MNAVFLVMYRTLHVVAAVIGAGFIGACSGAQHNETLSAEQNAAEQNAAGQMGEDSNALQPTRETAMDQPANDGGVANLPFARGEIFYSLDEYLAHLEKLSALDFPHWRQIKPGVYERVTSLREAEPEIATREELMQRFGFER